VNEPIWLTEQMVLAIHEDMISQYGGLFGVRDRSLLEASLARPLDGAENHNGYLYNL